jgi:Na+/H+ antiporter NhaD/arsenite permease-like protein
MTRSAKAASYGPQSLWRGGTLSLFALATMTPGAALASAASGLDPRLGGVGTAVGSLCLGLFIIAYLFVMIEEKTHLRKSKPVLVAAGLIWGLIAWHARSHPGAAEQAFRVTFLDFAELMLFLLVAMTFVNALTERNLFETLRSWLISRRFSYRQLYWITGGIAFLLSPVLDNMTTALVLGAVAVAVGRDRPKVVALCCISIVVAANASGAFSPFGDVTTLMVWQKGTLPFFAFFQLFLPALVNWLVPALIMSAVIPGGAPTAMPDVVRLKVGARRIVVIFILTIAITVVAHSSLHLPPVYGMMVGLGLLKLFSYYLNRVESRADTLPDNFFSADEIEQAPVAGARFNIFSQIAAAEWDTLLFFYGVILCVGGLAALGYLELGAQLLYGGFGPTAANVAVGLLSAVIDNIPIMFAVLTMNPAMDEGQWLLVTLTAGVGGSLLSIGSAAGVALMGTSRGHYTFLSHLKWTWAIALGYALSILAHLWVNAGLFAGS